MARWAHVVNGVVKNVVVADSAPNPSWIDVTGLSVGPGYTYDGETFAPPAAKAVSDLKSVLADIDALHDKVLAILSQD